LNESPEHRVEPTDADLATRAASGDQAALAAIFDRYAGHLLGFCRSMVRNQADADDCLQDVFVVAASRLDGLRQPDRLRSWLFAVARHTCLARIEKGARMVPTDDLVEGTGVDDDPAATRALHGDLAAMVDEAMAGLAPRDRLVLELADRQGLSTEEVAGALGMAPPSAYKVLVRARTTARRSLGAVLVARSGRRDCPELAALLGDWDGKLTPLVRKRVSRHIEGCVTCSAREKRMAAPGALLGAGAAVAIPTGLRTKVLQSASRALHAPASGPSAATDADRWVEGWPPSLGPSTESRRRRRVLAAVAVVVIIAAIVVVASLQPWSDGSGPHQAVAADAAGHGAQPTQTTARTGGSVKRTTASTTTSTVPATAPAAASTATTSPHPAATRVAPAVSPERTGGPSAATTPPSTPATTPTTTPASAPTTTSTPAATSTTTTEPTTTAPTTTTTTSTTSTTTTTTTTIPIIF